MPIPLAVWAVAAIAARVAIRRLAKEAAEKAAAEARKKLAREATKRGMEAKAKREAKEKLKKEADDKARAEAASKAPPAGNTAPKKHKGKEQPVLARCTLRPYKPDTCKPKTGHHVVPDRVFRIGARKTGERIPNSPTESEGLVICVDGKDLNKDLEHGQIHKKYDLIEGALGAKGTPKGTAKMIELETLGVMSVAKVTKCNAAAMLAQLRAFHQSKGMDYDATVRADPGGKISQALDPKKLGSGAYGSGQRRG